MKQFHGKAIYNPSGKAGEYSQWACNFYVGCSNDCDYCYCKKGILAGVMGQDKPQLKKCFRDEAHALMAFERELKQNLESLRANGLFFTFTSDPFLPETTLLTQKAVRICLIHDVPATLLTKRTDWGIDDFIKEPEINGTIWNYEPKKHLFVFGFTLTGHDELEPNASPNAERVAAMRRLHNAGFKTFASVEPIIDITSSMNMIAAAADCCDLFKVGLQSGKKYERCELLAAMEYLVARFPDCKFYFKDSFVNQARIDRAALPGNCVARDYNMFHQ